MPENIPLSDERVVPAPTIRSFRRVVTGLDEQGRSTVLEDGLSPHVQVVADTPTFVYTNLWRHEEVPVDNSGPADDGLGSPGRIAPPAAGSILRIVEFPPDSHWDTGPEVREAMFHSTPSLDYAIVLEGCIWHVMDADERELMAGDVLIQRGTRHLWSNRSDRPCLIAFVLIGGSAV
ncbi:cupin domain-containing protein [Geodermatophilus ruber]|uniref:Cupin domain-containing protein n=1 Tax=Geodermatophilus ruber TaxID=504800 RepID=A0A1I4BXZ4_9ACTN|nr:cupin domain-containing protein [Geodermatophilus ruber]SFK73688.1 hypothetical protein SAMN04488085_103255 [Geodermatophilus ruber]